MVTTQKELTKDTRKTLQVRQEFCHSTPRLHLNLLGECDKPNTEKEHHTVPMVKHGVAACFADSGPGLLAIIKGQRQS